MIDEFLKFLNVRMLEHVVSSNERRLNANEVVYGAKVKLHGTNGAVRIYNGRVTAQKRTADATIEDNNFEFAAWVASTADGWAAKNASIVDDAVIVYGEWCGKGIQGGSIEAVELVEPRQYFVFGVMVDGLYHSEPSSISRFVPDLPRVRIIPWLLAPTDAKMRIRYSRGVTLTRFASYVCEAVERVDVEDPYMLSMFKIKGRGEGIVAMPTSVDGRDVVTWDQFRNFVFKAKSARHCTKKSDRAARAFLITSSEIDVFVDQFVTEASCAQGVHEACDGVIDKSRLKGFYQWVKEDVREESELEMEAMDIPWKTVSKYVCKAAVGWYLRKCKER